MDEIEEDLVKDFVNFLNERGQYKEFLAWALERGYELNALEDQLELIDNL
jgi:hypothetical protein